MPPARSPVAYQDSTRPADPQVPPPCEPTISDDLKSAELQVRVCTNQAYVIGDTLGATSEAMNPPKEDEEGDPIDARLHRLSMRLVALRDLQEAIMRKIGN